MLATLVLGQIRAGARVEHGEHRLLLNLLRKDDDATARGTELRDPVDHHGAVQVEVEQKHVRVAPRSGEYVVHRVARPDQLDPALRIPVDPRLDALEHYRVVVDESDGD
jgi:hypothetical protein